MRVDVFVQSQVLWEHLVDVRRKYTFPVEMEVTVLCGHILSFHI